MAREAARIFLSLRDNPKDKEAQRAQNSFVSRGPEARAAYDRVATAWTASREKARPKGGGALALFLALSLAGYFSYDSLRIRLLADFTTSSAVSGFALTSGDRVILDAGSALADKTDEGLRVVELLQGSGFFDVNSSDFPFVVSAEDVSVEVKGTAFEVSRLSDVIQVAVAEGAVEVSAHGQTALLTAGQSVRVSATDIGHVAKTDTDMVAAWKEDRLSVDGMTVADVVRVLDRRLPGSIVITNRTLAQSRVTGRLDLSDPLQALRTMAYSRNAQVSRALPGLTILTPHN